jgi:hypothetical protein
VREGKVSGFDRTETNLPHVQSEFGTVTQLLAEVQSLTFPTTSSRISIAARNCVPSHMRGEEADGD